VHWLPWWAYPAGCCFLSGAGWGWLVGYAHRDLVEWGRRAGRLLAWRRKYRARNPLTCVLRAYSGLFTDIDHLCATGHLRPKRRDWRGAWR
jgi:hypothetical protein